MLSFIELMHNVPFQDFPSQICMLCCSDMCAYQQRDLGQSREWPRGVTSCIAISLSYIDGRDVLLFKHVEGHVAFVILPICQLRTR